MGLPTRGGVMRLLIGRGARPSGGTMLQINRGECGDGYRGWFP